MWTATADVVAEATLSQPQNMLDLASGAAAEPALTLARRFSGATVVASDSEAGVLEMAALRVSEERLADQVELQQIDMFDLVALGGSDGDAAIADVVTCSLGLFMLPPADHELCLRGVRKLLRPGGLLVATVWDRMALMELGG
ncbi:s-adenosyl-l-methionine-dependent methyltransferase, partial [Chrysochromulina tobinii]